MDHKTMTLKQAESLFLSAKYAYDMGNIGMLETRCKEIQALPDIIEGDNISDLKKMYQYERLFANCLGNAMRPMVCGVLETLHTIEQLN
jgi:hypothetical protein